MTHTKLSIDDGRNFTLRVPAKDLEALEGLVKDGYFINVTEAIRTAIRNLIREYKGVTPRQAVEHPYGGDKKETAEEG